MNKVRADRSSERGMSIVEVIVAGAIFLVIMVAALTIYDQSNKIFKTSVESADVQQNTRAGFDRLVSDVRMAGFDYDRDGVPTRAPAGPWRPSTTYGVGSVVSPTTANGYSYRAVTAGVSGALEPPNWPQTAGASFTGDGSITWVTIGPAYQQPDEQIEFAGRSAITIRGNLDYNNDLATNPHHGREADFEPTGGQFPIVTTGNDEIVTYALRSVNGPNPDSLTFYADVARPRAAYPGGSAERLVTIPNVDLCQAGCNNPPYTLMRFTINNDGSPTEGVPVANNVRDLEFFYYENVTGTQILRDLSSPTPQPVLPNGAIGGLGQFDPTNIGGTANWDHRTIRSRIQSVRVDLTGMNEEKDAKYVNPRETLEAVKNYRTYELSSLVTPRNLGLSGLAEPDTAPPGPPTVTSVCVGSCRITRVRWDPPLTNNADLYEVRWDTSPTGAFGNVGVVVPGDVVSAPVFGLAPGTMYHFKVVAVNENGRAESQNYRSRMPVNSTTPGPISNLVVTAGENAQQNKIALTFTSPASNAVANVSCDGLVQNGTPIDPAEPIRFRIWRGTHENFNPMATPPEGEVVLDSTETDPTETVDGQPVGVPGATISWIDDFTNVLEKPPANCKPYFYRVQVYDACALSTASGENNPDNPGTATSTIFPAATAGAVDEAIEGGANSDQPPSAPENLEVDFTANNSRCNRGLNTCTVRLQWDPVTTDTANPTGRITVDEYRVTRHRKKASDTTWVFDEHLPILENASSNPAAMSNTGKVIYTDTSALDHDDTDRRKWYYRYTVTALQCTATSAASEPAEFPESCGLARSTIIETGASSGAGTQASPWVMGAADTIEVTAPPNVQLSTVEYEIYPEPDTNSNSAPLDRYSTGNAPFTYAWQNQSDGQVYRVVITMTNSAGCVEQTERFIQDETVACASATLTQTGAAQGVGTENSPWVMNSGDAITVNAPNNSPIASLAYTLFLHPGNTAVDSPAPDITEPFGPYVWSNRTDNQKYRLLVSVVYVDGCAESFERYILDEPPPVCTGATMTATGASSGAGTSASPWLVNGGDTLTITPPANGVINQVVFTITPTSPAGTALPATTVSSAPFTLTWSDLTDRTTYRVDAAITYSSGCIETVTQYVTDEVCSGGVVSQNGSTGAGTGLTTSSPWVFNAGDVVSVSHATAPITSVAFRLFDEPGTTALASSTDAETPYQFAWTDRTNDALYRLEITVTYTPGCTETFRRYIRDQGACFITASDPTTTTVESTNDKITSITYEISNPSNEALTITGIQVGWARDAGHPIAVLQDVQFTGATSSTTSAGNTAPPSSGLVAVSNAPTVPANTSSYRVTVRFNIGKKQNVSDVTTSWINSLCIRYTAPSFGGTAASCNVLGSTSGNPTSCN